MKDLYEELRKTFQERLDETKVRLDFENDLMHIINKNSMEKYCGLPDYMISNLMMKYFDLICIQAEIERTHKAQTGTPIVFKEFEGIK